MAGVFLDTSHIFQNKQAPTQFPDKIKLVCLIMQEQMKNYQGSLHRLSLRTLLLIGENV